MTRKRGQRLPSGKVWFQGLAPVQATIDAAIAQIPRVSSPAVSHGSDTAEKLARRDAKLARRARRAGHDIEAFLAKRVTVSEPADPVLMDLD